MKLFEDFNSTRF